MAIGATFTASFEDFKRNVASAVVSVKTFERDVKSVEKTLSSMASSFSGARLIRDTTLSIKAVQDLGGVTKLTAAEQRQLAGTIDQALEKFRALGQTAPAEFAKIRAELGALTPTTQQLTAANASATLSVKSLAAGYVAGMATLQTAQAALRGLVTFVSESIDSYAAAEQATVRLTRALQNQGTATPAVLKSMEDLSAEFQATTRFSDDLVTEMQALFVQVGDVGPAQMRVALTAAADLAEGLGVDLEQASTAVAKALGGNATALQKLAPSLDQAAIKGGDLAVIADEINQRFGGQAAAQLDTYAGRVEQLKNDWDNLQEAIGRAIATDEILRAALRASRGGLDAFSGATVNLTASQWLMTSAMKAGMGPIAASIYLIDQWAQSANRASAEARFLALSTATVSSHGPARAAAGSATFVDELAAAEAGYLTLTQAQRANITAGLALKKSHEDIAKAVGTTIQVIGRFEQGQRAAATAQRDAAAAAKSQGEELEHVDGVLAKLAGQFAAVEDKVLAAMDVEALADFRGELTQVANRFQTVADFAAAAQIPIENTFKRAAQLAAMNPFGKPLTDAQRPAVQLRATLQDLSGAFADLAEISSGSLNTTLELFGKMAATASLATESVSAIRAGMKAPQTVAGLASISSGVLGLASAVLSLGAAVADALLKSRAEQTVERVAYEYGASIAESLAQGIEDTAEERFGGDRQAAKIWHLEDILRDGGGLSVANLGRMTARLRDVFSMVETGAFTAAEAQEVLNDNFKTFADFVTRDGGRITRELQEIIRLNDRLGTQSRAIAEFTSGQANAALDQLGGFITARGDVVDALAAAQATLAELSGKGDTKAIEATRTEIAKLQAQLGAMPLTAGGAAAFGASLFGAFDRLSRNGEDPLEAIRRIDPLIESLDRQLAQAGLSGGAAFDQIRAMAGLATDEIAGPALTAISQLGGSLDSLHNADILNPEIFSGLTDQIGATVDGLLAQGKTAEELYPFIQDELQTIWELQQDFGYEVSDSTEALLDQAEAAGVVGDQHRSVQEQQLLLMERQTDALEGLARMFGVVLPSDVAKFQDAIDDLPSDITIDGRVTFDVDDIPLPDGPVYTLPYGEGVPMPEHDEGAFIREDHTARVHAGELIGPVDFMSRALDGALARRGAAGEPSGAGATEVTVNVTIQAWDGADLERVVRSDKFGMAVAAAIAGGGNMRQAHTVLIANELRRDDVQRNIRTVARREADAAVRPLINRRG